MLVVALLGALLGSFSLRAEATSVPSGWHLAAGTTIHFRELELHIKGTPLSVYEIVYSFHPMNNPGAFEPIGLWVYNYIEAGAAGHAENCKRWFNQVAQDESQTDQVPFPYLEFDTQVGYAPIFTDEGIAVIPDSSVNCWEAMDFKGPR
ncbi:MAG: hypothetical protein P4M08_06920 [Oligoflexia bacterium]|nr:hypothetical protein [Oligoflexia bacterium]